MSFTTRCPACGTMFKVVADQLRVSQGWVRCGACSEVFDAGVHLQTADVAVAPPAKAGDFGQNTDLSTTTAGNVSVASMLREPPTGIVFKVSPTAAAPPTVVSAQSTQRATPVAPMPAAAGEVQRVGLDAEPLIPSPERPRAPSGSPNVEPNLDDVSFVKIARREALWQKTSVRVSLMAVALVLSLALVFQWLIYQRDQLAAADPRAASVLNALCQPFGCVVKPLRRIESLVIESASFSKTGIDGFRLGFVLKNTSELPLEIPSLELTLTDSQDKTVVRRALRPVEFGLGGRSVLVGRAEANGLVDMKLSVGDVRDSGLSAAPVVGYRVLVFYP